MSSNLDTSSRGLLWRSSLIYLLSTLTPHLSKMMENSSLCTSCNHKKLTTLYNYIACALNPYMPCSIIIRDTALIHVIIALRWPEQCVFGFSTLAMVNILFIYYFVSNEISITSKIIIRAIIHTVHIL